MKSHKRYYKEIHFLIFIYFLYNKADKSLPFDGYNCNNNNNNNNNNNSLLSKFLTKSTRDWNLLLSMLLPVPGDSALPLALKNHNNDRNLKLKYII